MQSMLTPLRRTGIEHAANHAPAPQKKNVIPLLWRGVLSSQDERSAWFLHANSYLYCKNHGNPYPNKSCSHPTPLRRRGIEHANHAPTPQKKNVIFPSFGGVGFHREMKGRGGFLRYLLLNLPLFRFKLSCRLFVSLTVRLIFLERNRHHQNIP